jgi:hypothetical protein
MPRNLSLILRALACFFVLGFARDAHAQFWQWRDPPCGGSAGSCRASITLSPFHLGYPIVLLSTELRLTSKLGIAADNAIGSFHGGSVGQFGLRLPFYPLGTFDGGIQLGPFARATNLELPDPSTLLPAQSPSPHTAFALFYDDVEFARANGRDALYFGVLLGAKFVVGRRGGKSTWLTGFTLEGGLLGGYHHLTRRSRNPPHPLASRTEDGFLLQLYVDVGWSF